MKFLPVFTLIIAFITVSSSAFAQVIDPKQTAADDATHRANSNISGTVDNGVGKTESAIKGLFKKKKKPAETPPPAPNTANNNAAPPSVAPSPGTPIRAYNNYDFVPGDKIIFEDGFADDQDGEFPAHWNLGKGQAVVNQVGGLKAVLITDGNYAHVSPLVKSPSYLGSTFTIEFDSYSTGGYMPIVFLYGSNADATAANNDLAKIAIGSSSVDVSNHDGTINLSGSLPKEISGENYLNKWHHVAMAYKNNQLKVYVDQYRILVVPNLGIKPGAFDIEGIGEAEKPIIVANFRVASGGGMNMLGKKFTDARIITHGINFDIDQATIKPESMGTLNMVAGVLKDNPDIRFEIGGHTDNTGTSPHNLTLSQQRADAVKTQLTSMGVDASRLSTKGFGDSKPLGSNDTPEGKANNRRVEFVKM